MNTCFHYLYRDASNYKQHGTVVFHGTLPDLDDANQQLQLAADEGEFFVAAQVDVEDLLDRWDTITDDDHCWHELAEPPLAITDHAPTDTRTIIEFITAFTAAGRNWDETDATLRLERMPRRQAGMPTGVSPLRSTNTSGPLPCEAD